MRAERRGAPAATAAVRGRPFRPAWSLAAGTGAVPSAGLTHVVVAALLAVDLLAVALLPTPTAWRILRSVDQGGGCATVFVALAALPFVRPVRARLGGMRRRSRGGAVWWRDRDWSTEGIGRWIAFGFRGTSVVVAVAATATVCSLAHFAVWLRLGWAAIWETTPQLAILTAVTDALMVAWLAIVLVPRLIGGRLIVAWPSFPQFTGGRCVFHVGTSPGGARIDGARVFLRCIRRDLDVPLSAHGAHLVWVGEARLRAGTYLGPESHQRVDFDVPSRAPPTDLHARSAVRWELLVLGTIAGADYADSVTVPVYAPGEPATADGPRSS
jgi:hypothetical protein